MLEKLWAYADMPCGKRFKPMIPGFLAAAHRFDELEISAEVESLLLGISSATLDRLLKPARDKQMFKVNRGMTKPGTLLKHQIPVRTFNDWDEDKPGFLEIDLVAHNGGVPSGTFLYTLDVTDIATQYTMSITLADKGQQATLNGLETLIKRFPFPVLGVDSDNGSEFINGHLLAFCEKNQLTFTRSRPSKKNDGCHIEQKNFTNVRKISGNYRYEGKQAINLMNQIWS